MLILVQGEYIDPELIEFAYEPAMDETGVGGTCTYRGVPGFIRLDAVDDRPVLINARCVVRLRQADEVTEIETDRGERILVKGYASWVATVLNKVRRVSRVA